MNTAKGSASLVRRQLGRRLRLYREEAGKNQGDVAEANVAGRTKLWRLEVRHEALLFRTEVGDLRRSAVVAVG